MVSLHEPHLYLLGFVLFVSPKDRKATTTIMNVKEREKEKEKERNSRQNDILVVTDSCLTTFHDLSSVL